MHVTPQPAAPAAPRIGHQVDRSFGPPMVYIDGDRRDRPPLITINVAHEHELLITDEQARALRAALDEALAPPVATVFVMPRPDSLNDKGDRRWFAVQTSAAMPVEEEHRTILKAPHMQAPRIYAEPASLRGFETVVGYFSDDKLWRCPCRWDSDDHCWRAVGPSGQWVAFSSIEGFNAWRDEHGATWERWARP